MSQDIQTLRAELKRLAEAAGGNEWFDDTGVGTFDGAHVWGSDGDAVCRCFTNLGHMPESVDETEVAAYIAAANPATLLALVAHIEALERQLADLRQAERQVPEGLHDLVLEMIGTIALRNDDEAKEFAARYRAILSASPSAGQAKPDDDRREG